MDQSIEGSDGCDWLPQVGVVMRDRADSPGSHTDRSEVLMAVPQCEHRLIGNHGNELLLSCVRGHLKMWGLLVYLL